MSNKIKIEKDTYAVYLLGNKRYYYKIVQKLGVDTWAVRTLTDGNLQPWPEIYMVNDIAANKLEILLYGY